MHAEGGCIPLVPSCGPPELQSLPTSGAHELVEAVKKVLIGTSFPELLNVDLTTYPQTWSLFRDSRACEER